MTEQLESKATEPDAELPQTAEHPVEHAGPSVVSEEDLELATLAFRGNNLILITPKHRYEINLGLGDNGIEARLGEIRRIRGGYVSEVTQVKSEGYSIDSNYLKD